MKTTSKLSSEERRTAIIKAVRKLFAEKGFYGTTTRELADAAGVSEALLFKHFPSKETLFSAIKTACCSEQDTGRFERLKALEPSASTLVLMIHFFVSTIVRRSASRDDEEGSLNRLVLRSLAEDGEFAHVLLSRLASHWIPKVEESIKAAIAAGDAIQGTVQPRLAGWFAHHLAAMIATFLLPAQPIIDYGVPCEQLINEAVWFVLRGMGLKEEAIQRYYNPQALALFDR
jgi:AcrR family transcriptional regulator